MNKDKGRLELAAKAAGIPVKWDENWNCLMRDARPVQYSCSEWLPWRPNADDGDALRLAVKLGLRVTTPSSENTSAYVSIDNAEHDFTFAVDGADDPYATTRLAIVCAAAVIGKAMP